MKKLLGILFVALLCAALLPALASAETSGTCGANLTWVLDDEGTLTISGTGAMSDLYYKAVTSKLPWGVDITTAVIEPGVTSIGGYAFYNCKNLASVTISNTVTSIDYRSFYGCSSLKSVTIPSDITKIGTDAFYSCSAILYANLNSDGAKTLSKAGYSFRSPGANYSLRYLFSNEEIVGLAICDVDKNATSLLIPKGVTNISNSAFKNRSNLTNVTIPEGVTNVGSSAFQGCSSLMNVTIPEGVTSIGDQAFYACKNLKSVTIPDTVSTIGNTYVFYGCPAILYANYNSNGAKALSKAGYSFRNPGSNYNLRYLFTNKEITGLAIYNVDKDATSVEIPESVTSIGSSAFKDCSTLTSITIPDNVTSIASSAFSGCSAILYAKLSSNGAKALSKAGYSFKSLGSNYNLRYLFTNEEMTGLAIYDVDKDATSVKIPESVTSIGSSAFKDCSTLTSVKIPEGVTNISGYAFQDCTSLTSITIPEGVTSIGSFAFSGCSGLTNVTIPESVTSIEEYAFSSCYKLNKACILGETTVFGSKIFGNGDALTIYCYEYSDADSWATSMGYKIVYLDATDVDDIRSVTLPDDIRLARGQSRKVNAEIFPADNTEITWSSSNPSVAIVEDGLITAVGPGVATITAAVGAVSDSMDVEIYVATEAFDLDPNEAWLVAKESEQISIVNVQPAKAKTNINWSSSDTALAIVDENGLVKTKKPGSVTITATDITGIYRECVLHLCYPVTGISFDPILETISVGDTIRLTAHVTARTQTYENKLVTFASADEAVATVSPEGLVTALKSGTTTITAAAASGVSASVEINVLCAEHTSATDPAVDPTCTETGLTEGSHCAVCGKVLVTQEEIPALGHGWSAATYEWAEDNSTVTASRVCLRDEAHTEGEIVQTVREVTKESTCAEAGEAVYTAIFENEAFGGSD